MIPRLAHSFPDSRAWLHDGRAGLSVAGLLIPEAVAYSAIAGVPAQHAIVAALAGLVTYALCGGSRFAIVAPTSSSAAILAAATMSLAPGDPEHRLVIGFGLVLLTGIFFLLGAAVRLGHLAAFISRPVLRGFAFGLALTIVLRQLPHITGVEASGNMAQVALALATSMPRWNISSVALGLCALAGLLALKRFVLVPGAFVVLGLGITASTWMDLGAHGVAVVGAIDLGSLSPGIPRLGYDEWLRLGELAFALLVILYAESWGSIRSLSLRYHEPVAANRELAALGAANVVSALVQGIAVGAGFSAAAANDDAGAQSKLSGIVAALAIALLVLLAGPLLARLPVAVLAAVVIAALLHVLDPRPLLTLWRLDRDQYLALAAAAGVIVFGVLDGMLLAVGLSVLAALRRFSQPHVRVLGQLPGTRNYVDLVLHAEAQRVPGTLILRPEEPLFFANAERVVSEARLALGRFPDTRVVVLSLEESSDLDSTGVEVLGEFVAWLELDHRSLLLARVKDDVRELLRRVRGVQTTAELACFWSVADAADAARDLVRRRD